MTFYKNFLASLDPRIRWVFLLATAVGVILWLGLVPLARHLEQTEQSFYQEKAEQLLELAVATNRWPLQEGLDGFVDLKMLAREPNVAHPLLLDREKAVAVPAGRVVWKKTDATHWQLGSQILDSSGTLLGAICFDFTYQSEVTRWMFGFFLLLLGVVGALGKICWPSFCPIPAVTQEVVVDWSWLKTLEEALDKKVLLTDAEGKVIATGCKIAASVQHLFDLNDARPELLWRALQEKNSVPGIQLIPWKGFFILCFD